MFFITSFLNKLRRHNPKAVLLVIDLRLHKVKKFPNTFAAAYARELTYHLSVSDVVVFDMHQMLTDLILSETIEAKRVYAAVGLRFTKMGYEFQAHCFIDKLMGLYEDYLNAKFINANKY